jgi:hypothetical protein
VVSVVVGGGCGGLVEIDLWSRLSSGWAIWFYIPSAPAQDDRDSKLKLLLEGDATPDPWVSCSIPSLLLAAEAP